MSLMWIGEANSSCWMVWIAALSRSITNRSRASGIPGLSRTRWNSSPRSRTWIRVNAKVRSRYLRPTSIALRQVGLLTIAKPQMPYVVRWYRIPASRPRPGGSPSARSRFAITVSSCRALTVVPVSRRLTAASPVDSRHTWADRP